MDACHGFIAQEQELFLKNRKALLNLTFEVFYYDSSNTRTNFNFPGYSSAYFRAWNTLNQIQLLKSFTSQVTQNSNSLVMNCSVLDMTFNDPGIYWYEMGYVSSGYDIAIRYGRLTIIP